MHVPSMTTLTHSVQSGAPRRPLARLAVVAIALLTCAVAGAQGLPQQQLTVAFTNAFPNGSLDALTMPNPIGMPNSAAIVATDPLLTGGTPQNLYTALTWVTNPATSTLDMIYADAEQHKIWRLPGPLYKNPVVIFSWSGKGSGPAYPSGLAADLSGNVYVISPSTAWDKPGVWVLPITKTGTYGRPLLIDNTFDDPMTHKPVSTLALTDVAVAGKAATGGSPDWNALDLLVLVADPSNTRVIRYSQAQIQSVLGTKAVQQGPASNVVTPAQFLTQATKKIAPIPVGMDFGQDPTTHDMTLLVATVDGRILDFDSATNAFITPYAINLGLGLTRVKVGTFQGAQYVFVAQLPGRIMEFAAPPAGHSNTSPFASVSKGVSNPTDLAVTQSGSTSVGQQGQGPCISAPCSILPQLSLQFTGPGTANFPPNDSIAVDSCNITADPRVTIVEGFPTYNYIPLNLGLFCTNLPNVWLSANLFGGSGPTGAGIYVEKITATALNQFSNITNTTPVNNTLTTFTLNPGVVLGANPPCGSANGPVVGAGPLPGSESTTPELSQVPGAASVVYDITVDCSSDPPPGGNNNHPSILVEGTVQGGLSLPYIDSEFSNLQQAFNSMVTPPVQPPGTQINAAIQSTIQGYITNSQNYFNQQNYNCALNTLATGARAINTTVNSNPGYFLAGPPPSDNENPSGDLLARLDHLYYDIYVFAFPPPANPPLTTDALNPATAVPACTPLGPPLTLAATPNPIGGTFGILTLTWTVNNPSLLPATTSCGVVTTDPDSPSWVVPPTVTLDAPPNNSMTYALTDSPSSNGSFTISLNCSVNGAVVSASAPFTVVTPFTESNAFIFENASGQGSPPPWPDIIDYLSVNVPVNGGCSLTDGSGVFGTVPVSGVVTNGFYYPAGFFPTVPKSVTWTLSCPDNPEPVVPVQQIYTVYSAGQLTLSANGDYAGGTYDGDSITLSWTFSNLPVNTTCTLSSTDTTNFSVTQTPNITQGGGSTTGSGTSDPLITGNGSYTYIPSPNGTYTATLTCNGITSTAMYQVTPIIG